jgi:ubiquinone/menaquinone biosynthesis C-methylase UbiE
MKQRSDRELMVREMVRVLKPGGRVALLDFIFTGECVQLLRNCGLENASRMQDGFLSFWIFAILNFGAVQTYLVLGTKG